MKRIIGGILIALPFVVLLSIIGFFVKWWVLLGALAGAGLIAGSIWLGIHLLQE